MRYPYTVDEAWRVVRALRHSPPGQARANESKLLFTAATKQSEQLFRLSDQAGYETKPILLYYGLNQASRAVRAVIDGTSDDEDSWSPKGHGLSCPNLDDATAIGDLIVKSSKQRGSFQKLAECADSVTFRGEVPLRELWASTPEGARVLLQGSDAIWCCAELQVAGFKYASSVQTVPGEVLHSLGIASTTMSTSIPVNLTNVPQSKRQDLTGSELRQEIQQRYPDLIDFEPPAQPDGRLREQFHPAWSRRSGLTLSCTAGFVQLDSCGLIGGIGDKAYRNLFKEMWLIPTLDTEARPMHPILNWWAILFPLSMLARYQPSSWTRILDVDNSADATAIEYVLNEAHRACANLIAHFVQELETSDRNGIL